MRLKEETQFQYTGHAIHKRQFLRLLPGDLQRFSTRLVDRQPYHFSLSMRFRGKSYGEPYRWQGDDGKYEEDVYTYCKNHPVKIKVKYFYASEDRCVGPDETRLTVNPNLGALVGADEIGSC